jgi:hypothetical protein
MKTLRILLFIGIAAYATVQPQEAKAAIPIAKIIKEAVKKVIKAVDLMIQRLQTKTIYLQNAQKVLENKLNELKLKEIAEWTEKQRKLYKEYYDELWKVKDTISKFQKIQSILRRQARILREYQHAWSIISNDRHFTAQEIKYMASVYGGIIRASERSIDELSLAIKSDRTQMSDGERLAILSRVEENIEVLYSDLRLFNNQNKRLSMSRAKNEAEVKVIEKLYEIQQ